MKRIKYIVSEYCILVPILAAVCFILMGCAAQKTVYKEKVVEVPVYLHEVDTHYVEVSKEVYIHDTLHIIDSVSSYVDKDGVAHADKVRYIYISKDKDKATESEVVEKSYNDIPVEVKTTETEVVVKEKKEWGGWSLWLLIGIAVAAGFEPLVKLIKRYIPWK